MPAMQAQTYAERRHRQGVNSQLQEVHDQVPGALRGKRGIAQAQENEQMWATRNKGFEDPDLVRRVAYVLLVIGLIAVYCLDFLLFRATADYFARTAFYDWPVMITVAGLVIPAVIIAVEV